MGLIPSLTQPVLGADGRLALKQGAHPPVFLPLSDPEIPLTSIRSLLVMDRCWSVLTALVCVESAHKGVCICVCVYACVCMFSVPVDSSGVLTLFNSVVYLMKTDERCNLYRAVASAVTYNTFFSKNPSAQ